MYSTLKSLSVFALAGTALAAPALEKRKIWGQWNVDGYWHGSASVDAAAPTTTFAVAAPTTTVVVVTTTAAVTSTYGAPEGQFYQGGFSGKPTTTAETSAAKASAAPSSQPTSGNAPSANSDYMTIVNYYRGQMGKSSFSQSSQLEANALKTATDDQGTMNHELNDGSMAQVLAPGDQGEFLHCFVGGWLCEIPSLLSADTCAQQSQGWSYDGTGHADILSSSSYSKIGCAWNDGIWACDLA